MSVLTTIFMVFLGIGLGFVLRRTSVPAIMGHGIMPVVSVLLFLMGLKIGANAELMRELPRIGLQSLLFTLAGTLGSLLTLRLVWRWLGPVLPRQAMPAGGADKPGAGGRHEG